MTTSPAAMGDPMLPSPSAWRFVAVFGMSCSRSQRTLVVRLKRNRFRNAASSQIDDPSWLFLGGGPGTHLGGQRLAAD
ncbi:hypothetical protein ABZ942_42260 [Nocardia sp. NPDC046473]|uniref:hypothetical protein n=1 Tax=Nocardia sp. NPDC046473 TaxID=3155733 RepID=UPI00340E3F54